MPDLEHEEWLRDREVQRQAELARRMKGGGLSPKPQPQDEDDRDRENAQQENEEDDDDDGEEADDNPQG